MNDKTTSTGPDGKKIEYEDYDPFPPKEPELPSRASIRWQFAACVITLVLSGALIVFIVL